MKAVFNIITGFFKVLYQLLIAVESVVAEVEKKVEEENKKRNEEQKKMSARQAARLREGQEQLAATLRMLDGYEDDEKQGQEVRKANAILKRKKEEAIKAQEVVPSLNCSSDVSNVYITRSKLDHITKLLSTFDCFSTGSSLNTADLDKVLSRQEQKYLYIYISFLGSPDDILNRAYKSIKEIKQLEGAALTGNYVFIGNQRSYHSNIDCEYLKSDFKNFKIPAQIEDKGEEAKDRFRNFFATNMDIYEENLEVFIMRMNVLFNTHITYIEPVKFNNSGVEEILDCSLEELEKRTEDLLEEMNKFRNSDKDISKEIRDSGFATHKAFLMIEDKKMLKKDIENHSIKKWHDYKNRLKTLIKEYYRIKLNRDFKFDEKVLSKLGFKRCGKCFSRG